MGSGSSVVAAGPVNPHASLDRARERFLIHLYAHNKPYLEDQATHGSANGGILTTLLKDYLGQAQQYQSDYVTAHALLSSFNSAGLTVDPTRLADLLWATATLHYSKNDPLVVGPELDQDQQAGIVDQVHFHYPSFLSMLDGDGRYPEDIPLVTRGLKEVKSRDSLLVLPPPNSNTCKGGDGVGSGLPLEALQWRLIQAEKQLREGNDECSRKEALGHIQTCLSLLSAHTSSQPDNATLKPVGNLPGPAADPTQQQQPSASSDLKACSCRPGPDAAGVVVDIWGAAKRGDLAMLKAVMGEDKEVWHARDDKDNTALYYSCLCGHLEVCDFLIQCMGGLGAIPKDDLLRNRTNALNADIRDLLDGGKPLKDIQANRLQRRDSQIRKEALRHAGNSGNGDPVDDEEEEEVYGALCIFESDD